MKNKLLRHMRTLAAATTLLTSLSAIAASAQAQQGPEPVYSIVAAWIGDHDYILPYRKEALPFVLEQGASWTHLYFPDSFYQEGFELDQMPDELHVMRFNDMAHMQAIFAAPEYTEPAEKFFYKAFSNVLGFPAAGDSPTKGANGNYENYFVTGMIDLKDNMDPTHFKEQFTRTTASNGLKEISQLTFMMPPGTGAPELALIASFENKPAFESFMETRGHQFFSNNTKRYALIGGYDTKRPRQ